jgi:hypothetical protein
MTMEVGVGVPVGEGVAVGPPGVLVSVIVGDGVGVIVGEGVGEPVQLESAAVG